jgi:exopolysaccharide production protein ExoQ
MTTIAYAALWTFVFAVPWETVITLPGLAIVTRVTGMIAAVLALMAVVVSGRARPLKAFHVWAVLFVLWIACELMFFNTSWTKLPNKFLTFVQLLVVLWIAWEVAVTRKQQLGLLTAYVMGCYIAALDTLLVYRRESAVLRRFAAGEADPNDLAMTLALGFPMAWYLGMTYDRPLIRWLCRLYIPVGLLGIGLTGSRGGMVASIVGLSLIPWTLNRVSSRNRALALVLIMMSGVLAVRYVPTTLIERFASTQSDIEEGKVGGRLKLWVAGAKAFSYKPIVGYGVTSFKRAIDPYLYQQSQVAHNSYLSVLVEEGLVGLFLWMLMLSAAFFAILKLPLDERRFALVLFATLLITMLPLTWEDRKQVWVVLAMLVGLSQARVAEQAAMRRAAERARHHAAMSQFIPKRAARTIGGPIPRPRPPRA